MMKTRSYKGIGPELSLLGLGCMRLPLVQPGHPEIDEEKAFALVDEAMRGGIRYYDTAYFYHNGMSEPFMGRALARYPRESFYMATKMPVYSLKTPEDTARVFDEQLARLQTKYFDFYLCHALNAESFANMEKIGVYDFLRQKKAEGAIRHLGFSFHDSPEVLRTIADAHEWDFAQLQLNYLDWEMQHSAEQYHILEERGIPCVVMEPVRGGALADLGEEADAVLKAVHPDRSIASWALRYAAGLPNVMTVLSGMSSMEQLRDNLSTFEHFEPLNDAEQAALQKALQIFRQRTFVPCTGCRYCADCPQSIDIPKVFQCYNEYALHHSKRAFLDGLAELPEGHRPENCIACGLCASRCPQHITIPAHMAEYAALKEKG